MDPPNQELLDILREKHPKGVDTSEIVQQVDLKHDAVRDRMMGWTENRVESGIIGSEDDYTLVWHLAESE